MNMSEPKQFRTEGLRGAMRCDVPMSRHASWRAGGAAERMYQPADLDDLLAFLRDLFRRLPFVEGVNDRVEWDAGAGNEQDSCFVGGQRHCSYGLIHWRKV